MGKEPEWTVERFAIFTCDECEMIHVVTLDDQEEIVGQILVHPQGVKNLISMLQHTKSIIDGDAEKGATHDAADMLQ